MIKIDTEYERQQIYMAINYYEQSLQREFSASHAREIEQTICSLNRKLQEIERR
jgi:hypothetical protein